MPTRMNPDKVKADAETILRVWKDNAEFKLKDVTLETFDTDTSRLIKLLNDIAVKEQEMTPLRNERDDLSLKLNEVCTRARSGIKGFYGPNSSQYEQVGGTRAVERKKPQRKGVNGQPPK